MTADGWFGLLGTVFTIPATLGYYQFLKNKEEEHDEKNKLLWLPVVIMFVGLAFLCEAYMITLAVSYKIAPLYMEATDPAPFVAVASGLFAYQKFLFVVSSVLTFTIGLGGISLIALSSPKTPKWLDWIGIVCGILGLGWIGTLASGVAGKIFLVVIIANFATFMVWVVVMGVLMLLPPRTKPSQTA